MQNCQIDLCLHKLSLFYVSFVNNVTCFLFSQITMHIYAIITIMYYLDNKNVLSYVI